MSSALLWLVSAFVICLVGSSGLSSLEFAQSYYTVSQVNRLLVHDDGRVETVLNITFYLQPNSTLSKSHKSILPITGGQMIEEGSVSVRDQDDHDLAFNYSIQKGWHRVDFGFILTPNSRVTNEYVVLLRYSILKGFCRTSSGRHRLDMKWAQLWRVPVNKSSYEIAFAEKNNDQALSTTCFGSFGRTTLCGRYDLKHDGKHASFETKGKPYGAFFTWVDQSSKHLPRQCQEVEQETSTGRYDDEALGQSSGADAKREDGVKAEKTNNFVLMAVIVVPITLAIIMGVLFFARMACKSTGSKKQKASASSSDRNTSPPDRATVQPDLEEGSLPVLLTSTSPQDLKSRHVDFVVEEDQLVKTNQLPSLAKPRPPPLDVGTGSISMEHCEQTWSAMEDGAPENMMRPRSRRGCTMFSNEADAFSN